jgi:hypothetical protein
MGGASLWAQLRVELIAKAPGREGTVVSSSTHTAFAAAVHSREDRKTVARACTRVVHQFHSSTPPSAPTTPPRTQSLCAAAPPP